MPGGVGGEGPGSPVLPYPDLVGAWSVPQVARGFHHASRNDPTFPTPGYTVISDPLAVFLVLATIVLVALKLEARFPLFRALGAALVGILIGMLLSNTGVLPGESPAYQLLMGPGVSMGVVLILLGVDMGSIRQAGPKMLGAFGIGALGTAIGAMVGGVALASMIGPDTWKLTGQFTGTYTGGGLNFAALAQAFDTPSDLFTAVVAADVIVTAVWMMACLAVPMLFAKGRMEQAPEVVSDGAEMGPPDASPDSGDAASPSLAHSLYSSGKPVPIADTAALVVISVGAVWLAGVIADLVPVLPAILWLTTLALIVAQIPAVKALSGGAMWGNYLILLFLASNGARSVIANIVEVGPAVFYFAIITVTVHGLVIFGLERAVGIDTPTLAVASQANVGGPASAMALASARGYTDRLLPGIAVGLLGYAAGNYAGFAIAALARTLLGG